MVSIYFSKSDADFENFDSLFQASHLEPLAIFQFDIVPFSCQFLELQERRFL